MRFSIALFVAGTIASELATPVVRQPTLVRRDLATISGVLANVLTQVTTLYDVVANFTGTGTQIDNLTFDTGDVISAITQGTKTVQGTSAIDLQGALALTPQIQNLSAITYATVATIIMKKQAFVDAGIGAIVLQTFKTQLGQSNALSAAVLSKIPESVQAIGANLSAPVTQALEAGINAFNDQSDVRGSSAGALATSPALAGVAAILCSAVVAMFAIV